MPTEKPRITIAIGPKTLEAVNDFRFDRKFKNQTQAILALIERGLSSYGLYTDPASAAHLDGAMQVASHYDALDIFGQRALRRTAEMELERMEAQRDLAAGPLAARGYHGEPLSTAQPLWSQEAEKSDIDF